MKTSNKLLVAAIGLVLGSLATYDAALRAEYRTGNYKNPLYSYDALAFRNFDAVNVPAASALNVKIVAGPFGVHVNKEVAEFIQVTQQGEQLTVALAYPKERKWLGRRDAVVISCPQLQQLTTDGVYTVAGKTHLDKLEGTGVVKVLNFAQDSLVLKQDHAGKVHLTGNRLGLLRATAGASAGSAPGLSVDADNRIQSAHLILNHQSWLELAPAIPALHTQFSDSSNVKLTGAAAHNIGAQDAR